MFLGSSLLASAFLGAAMDRFMQSSGSVIGAFNSAIPDADGPFENRAVVFSAFVLLLIVVGHLSQGTGK